MASIANIRAQSPREKYDLEKGSQYESMSFNNRYTELRTYAADQFATE